MKQEQTYFNNQMGVVVHVMLDDGEVKFSRNELCSLLHIKDIYRVGKGDEKVKVDSGHTDRILSETTAMQLLMRSRKPNAHELTSWFNTTVLPSCRRKAGQSRTKRKYTRNSRTSTIVIDELNRQLEDLKRQLENSCTETNQWYERAMKAKEENNELVAQLAQFKKSSDASASSDCNGDASTKFFVDKDGWRFSKNPSKA